MHNENDFEALTTPRISVPRIVNQLGEAMTVIAQLILVWLESRLPNFAKEAVATSVGDRSFRKQGRGPRARKPAHT